jgi:CheY-like chemotaxis protein/anti-sigma regulatory factor (Ser/Thr protein kinase)
VRRALEHHSYTLRAIGVELQLDMAPALPLVHADPLQLQQVVSNLIANAEQALADRDGPRTLHVGTVITPEGVRLTVRDSGPGISAQHLPRILEPMFTTWSGRGHRGLGLTITHTIVRDHGGSLHVSSQAGGGTEVVVTLLPADAAARPTEPRPIDVDQPTESAATAPAPQRILLIEDEQVLRSAISRFLHIVGYAVDAVESGSDALDLLAHSEYDLILLDLRMKGISGEDVYEAMQTAHPALLERLVFMTGDLHSAAAARFIRRTGRPVLAKPFTLSELATRVRQLLPLREG